MTTQTTDGTNAWRAIEGMVGDRRISRKLKRNVVSSCVITAYTVDVEVMTLIEKQQ